MSIRRSAPTIAITLLLTAPLATTVSGNHSWGNYHWARTQNPFELTIVNSTTTDWDAYVSGAVSDWSQSSVLDMTEVNGSETSRDRRQCRPPAGQIRICNLAYGYNGWLGLAGITIDTDGHILTGYTKLNDSYFGSGYYNTFEWKQTVVCQELGHDIGLDHQDTNFNNQPLFSCMDYQDPPYPYPNAHDYEELQTIYAHVDSYDSYVTGGSDSGGGTCNAPPGKGCNKSTVGQSNTPDGWGISLGRRGAHETFIRIEPDGTRHLTFVTWADRQ